MMMEGHYIYINDYYCLDKDDEFDENKVEEYEVGVDDMNVDYNNQQLVIEQDMMNSMKIHW
jgi:hypothetical protein